MRARQSPASVFKLCKSNINAKPVINNLSRLVERGPRKSGTFRFYEKEEQKTRWWNRCERNEETPREGGEVILYLRLGAFGASPSRTR